MEKGNKGLAPISTPNIRLDLHNDDEVQSFIKLAEHAYRSLNTSLLSLGTTLSGI